jgi:hypothetical protein
VVSREPGRILDRRQLDPGGELQVLWDGRFTLRRKDARECLSVEPLGEAGRRALPPAVISRLRRSRIPASAVAALPSLRRGAGPSICPPLRAYGLDDIAGDGFDVIYCARVPLAGAPFTNLNVVSNAPRLIYRNGTGGRRAPGLVPPGPDQDGAAGSL